MIRYTSASKNIDLPFLGGFRFLLSRLGRFNFVGVHDFHRPEGAPKSPIDFLTALKMKAVAGVSNDMCMGLLQSLLANETRCFGVGCFERHDLTARLQFSQVTLASSVANLSLRVWRFVPHSGFPFSFRCVFNSLIEFLLLDDGHVVPSSLSRETVSDSRTAFGISV